MVAGIKSQLTKISIAALKVGEWANDAKPRGAGQLQARKLSTGDVAFYYRYTAPDRKQVRMPLGTGLSLAQARDAATVLSRRWQGGERDLKAAVAAEARELERQEELKLALEAAAAAQRKSTLGALLIGYSDDLVRRGRVSASSTRRALKLHVESAWPLLWSSPIAEVTADDLLRVVARLADQNKLREAAKLRSYLRAAYSTGMKARRNATATAALRDLQVSSNPAAELNPIDGSSEARERALSVSELRAYWARISTMAEPDGALLRFHLLTGAQRIEQLARLNSADIDLDAEAITLRDGKGRRRVPRLHVVPLIPAAGVALKIMEGERLGPYTFSVTGGFSPAAYAMVQNRVRKIAQAMLEAGELEQGLFTPGDLRRTVETRLAAAGVSKEIRAHLQSHGLGGVQDKHYDRYGYLDEKRKALLTLWRLIADQSGVATKVPATRRGVPPRRNRS